LSILSSLGLLLAAHVTAANEQERAQVKEVAQAMQDVTQNSVEAAFVDQGYTGEDPKNDAQQAGIELIVVKLPEAKRGFVLLPRRWIVERSFAWTARFRRLARHFERTPETFRSLHFLAFAILMLHTFVKTIAHVL
jgi:transposase